MLSRTEEVQTRMLIWFYPETLARLALLQAVIALFELPRRPEHRRPT